MGAKLMELLLPILELSGPDFLLFYGGLFLFCLVGSIYGVEGIEKWFTRPGQSRKALRTPGAYSFAFAQGGSLAVEQIAIYELLLKGDLKWIPDKRQLQAAPGAVGGDRLEARILHAASSPRSLDALVRRSGNAPWYDYVVEELRDAGVFKSRGQRLAEVSLIGVLGLLFVLMGAAKYFYARSHGHQNTGALAMALVLGPVILGLFGSGRSSVHSESKAVLQNYRELFRSLLVEFPVLVRRGGESARAKRKLALAIYGPDPLVAVDPVIRILVPWGREPAGSGNTKDNALSSDSGGSSLSSWDSSICSSSEASADSSCGGGCGGGCGGCGGGD